jgi:hypothetical protein
MKVVNMMAQHIPEIQITLGECSSLRQKPGPRIMVRATARARALKLLRQKVTSKLGVESRCRVTTPAMLQSRFTKINRDIARECVIVFKRRKKCSKSVTQFYFPVGGFSPRSARPVVKTTVFQTPSLSVGGLARRGC